MGMLRLMELQELIAASAADYVRIALEVAQDAARNAALREAIAARRAALFDRQEPVQAFADALLRIAAGEARKTGAGPL